jgi:hypothetical protein
MASPGQTLDRFNHTSSAYNFTPGSTSQCLESGMDVGISGNADRSVSFWVQSDNTPTGTERAAFAWGDDSGNGTNFGASETGVGLSWIAWLAGTADISTGELATTNWEHWVVTTSGGLVYAYKDSVLVINGVATTVATLDSHLYVGCGKVAGVLNNPYKGKIDDVRVYNQRLGDADVANLYAVTRP